MNPHSAARHGFFRVAAVTPPLRLADPPSNAAGIVEGARRAADRGADVILFPELCLTGYTCADLFLQERLLQATLEALRHVASATADLHAPLVLGLPLEVQGRLFNCAAFVQRGRVLGITAKSHLPNTAEYYEQRWFRPAPQLPVQTIPLWGESVPIGAGLLYEAQDNPSCVIGVEICEDLWAVHPPSGDMALNGATLVLNLSASNEVLGKAAYRRDLVLQQSARCLAGYAYVSAGPEESSTDLVFSGHSLIAENGVLLAEGERFHFGERMLLADVDLDHLRHERRRNSVFGASSAHEAARRIAFTFGERSTLKRGGLLRPLSSTPFVPQEEGRRAAVCEEIFILQATGLARRLRHVGSGRCVLGVSGGLDSTLALLVAARACDILGTGRGDVLCVSMPGCGTSQRTYDNATRLVRELGANLRIIPIEKAVLQHFADIGHDPAVCDVTFENAQARERTQILMDLANQEGGIVLGTSDLSESALGWCTYNGDHMAMYHVNIGVPKTLVRHLLEWCAEEVFSGEIAAILRDIRDTPITPELLPADGAPQETEASIGPYVLHDFFLYHMMRRGAPPSKVLFLACRAFAGEFGEQEIVRWLGVFYRRFFAQQFKRSAMPDGPKVGSVALSPRGDWRMPSDADVRAWLEDLERD